VGAVRDSRRPVQIIASITTGGVFRSARRGVQAPRVRRRTTALAADDRRRASRRRSQLRWGVQAGDDVSVVESFRLALGGGEDECGPARDL